MAPIDIVVLAVIGIAFVAVCVRIYRKEPAPTALRAAFARGIVPAKTCAALKGVDKIAEDLAAVLNKV